MEQGTLLYAKNTYGPLCTCVLLFLFLEAKIGGNVNLAKASFAKECTTYIAQRILFSSYTQLAPSTRTDTSISWLE